MSAVEDRPAIYPRPGSNKSFFAYPSTSGDVTILDSDQYFRLVPVRRLDKGPVPALPMPCFWIYTGPGNGSGQSYAPSTSQYGVMGTCCVQAHLGRIPA
jgi:hypothetical protein